jgi:hypothetical protein
MLTSGPNGEDGMIAGRYRGHIFDAVARAVVTGETLHVHETAAGIAYATGSYPFLDAIADALVEEGLRRRAILAMGGRRPAATRRPN